MTRFPFRLFTLLLLICGLAYVGAQELSADEVLDHLEASADALEDASFLLTGNLIDPDGTRIALEIEIQVVPEARAASAYIIQPDALADNQIVLDGEVVYNYLFLTNQVQVFDADDPDALGGLLPEREGGGPVDVDIDLGAVFAGYDASVADYVDTPLGPAYRLRFSNREQDAVVVYVEALVTDGDATGEWTPYRLTFYQEGDVVMAELTFEDFVRDQGLDPTEVTYLPEDAEVIDERR